MIKIGARLIMDLLEHPRDIRDGHGNIIRVFSVGPGYFMVIKENIETREQLYWSDIYELGQPLKTNYYIIPMEEGFNATKIQFATEYMYELHEKKIREEKIAEKKENS